MEMGDQRSRRWRGLGAVVAGLAATACGFVALAPPAAAHSTRIYHGSDYGDVTTSHTTVGITDMECDGNMVVIQFQVNTDSAVRETMDLNECSTGGNLFFLPSGQFVVGARVCERNVGCTAWRQP